MQCRWEYCERILPNDSPGLTPLTLAYIYIKGRLLPAGHIFLDYPFLLSDQLASAFLPYLKDPKLARPRDTIVIVDNEEF